MDNVKRLLDLGLPPTPWWGDLVEKIEACRTKQPLKGVRLLFSQNFLGSWAIITDAYIKFIENHVLSFPRGSLILDSGAGIGRITIPLASKGYKVIALDNHSSSLQYGKTASQLYGLEGMIEWKKDDMKTVGTLFPDEHFDITLLLDSLNYLNKFEDMKETLTKHVRLTKKNGLVIIASPDYRYLVNYLLLNLIFVPQIAEMIDQKMFLDPLGRKFAPLTQTEFKALISEANLEIQKFGSPIQLFLYSIIPETLWKSLFYENPKLAKKLRRINEQLAELPEYSSSGFHYMAICKRRE